MTHVADGALMRWLDQECDAAERGDVARHLESCDACQARLIATRRRAELVRAALCRFDVRTAPPSQRTRWAARAAAAAMLLAAIGATVAPVRAWVVDRVTAIWSGIVEPSQAPSSTLQASPGLAPARATVTFSPAGEVFVVEVTARQAEGRLIIETRVDETVTAIIEGGDGSEQLVVLPTGLRVVNDSGGRASYRIRLPSLVKTVHAVIAGSSPIRFDTPAAGERHELPLHPGFEGTAEARGANR